MQQLKCLVTAGVLAILTTGVAEAQEPGSVIARDSRVQGRTYTFPGTGKDVPYARFVPSSYTPSREWPLMVALHGLGRPYDWMLGYEGLVDTKAPGQIANRLEGFLGRADEAGLRDRFLRHFTRRAFGENIRAALLALENE